MSFINYRRSFLKSSIGFFSTSQLVNINLVNLILANQSMANTFKSDNSISTLNAENQDHFFLHIQVDGGFDPLYFFDSRPLEMTEKKLQVNYNKEEPTRWIGKNNQSCFATNVTKILEPFKDNFSIVNGVMMATTFDGHDQNTNYLFSGNPFGGESFIPHLNYLDQTSLDGLINGQILGSFNNLSKMVPLSPNSAKSLLEKVKLLNQLDFSNQTLKFAGNRMFELGGDPKLDLGRFSVSSRQMDKSFNQMPDLINKLSTVTLDENDHKSLEEEVKFVQLIGQFFRAGIAKTAVISLSNLQNSVDTHDSDSTKKSVDLSKSIAEKLNLIFNALKNTEYKNGQSLMDVTTFVFTSEFGRTMRQTSSDFENSGTDHNPLNNCVLIGGKGIQGGKVIGASDFSSSNETLSKAHLNFDPGKIKTMGRPFDFSTGMPRLDRPDVYNVNDYLNVASVINTIYSIFGVPQEKHRNLGRNLPSAPIIKHLI